MAGFGTRWPLRPEGSATPTWPPPVPHGPAGYCPRLSASVRPRPERLSLSSSLDPSRVHCRPALLLAPVLAGSASRIARHELDHLGALGVLRKPALGAPRGHGPRRRTGYGNGECSVDHHYISGQKYYLSDLHIYGLFQHRVQRDDVKLHHSRDARPCVLVYSRRDT
jgi:hypothetical protein